MKEVDGQSNDDNHVETLEGDVRSHLTSQAQPAVGGLQNFRFRRAYFLYPALSLFSITIPNIDVE